MKEPTCPNHPQRPGKMPGGLCDVCYFERLKAAREKDAKRNGR